MTLSRRFTLAMAIVAAAVVAALAVPASRCAPSAARARVLLCYGVSLNCTLISSTAFPADLTQ